jgi:hypothetical protein
VSERASFSGQIFQGSLVIFEIMLYRLMLSTLRIPVNRKTGLRAGSAGTHPPT